jgi:hypothetical protein
MALIKFNDGRDEIFVTAEVGFGYDSNIFATRDGDGDSSINGSVLLEYQRMAGMLGVNANVGWTYAQFNRYEDENFSNPRFEFELTKNSGRTTGSARISAQKENRADSAINLRTESWNYAGDLTVKYPVIERYSLSGKLGYDHQDFEDNTALVDIRTYSAGADLFYALNSERDLTAGYRYRTTDTTADTTDRDHAFNVGVEGKIIPKLNGSARIGVQNREIDHLVEQDSSHTSLMAELSTTWTVTTRFSLTGDLSKDFATLATNESVDTTSASLSAQYAVNSKTAAFAAAGYGHLRFIESDPPVRRDVYATFNLGLAYTFNDRLKITGTYGYFQNWSTLDLSDFDRHSFSINVSSRW